MTDDARLVARFLRARDEPAFLALYRRHTPVIYRIAWRSLGGRADDAAECVQETWIRAIEGMSGFRGESSLRTWLCGIALNLARAGRRKVATIVPGDTERAPATRPSQDAAVRIDLERAIAALPDGYREAIVLHDIEGFTHAEIATMLDIEEGTSRSQLHHARRSLRALLSTGVTP